MPLFRKDSSRKRAARVSKLNSLTWKIVRVRLEGDDGAAVLRGTHLLHRVLRLAFAVLLLIDLAIAVYFGEQHVAQRIHAAHTHAVQTTGDLVAVLVELATGVQHGHDHLQGATAFLGVHIHGDSTAVVLHADTVVRQDV